MGVRVMLGEAFLLRSSQVTRLSIAQNGIWNKASMSHLSFVFTWCTHFQRINVLSYDWLLLWSFWEILGKSFLYLFQVTVRGNTIKVTRKFSLFICSKPLIVQKLFPSIQTDRPPGQTFPSTHKVFCAAQWEAWMKTMVSVASKPPAHTHKHT